MAKGNRTTQKQFKIGVQLFVSQVTEAGKPSVFEMVEGFFPNNREAMRYKERHYPTNKFQIKGLRFNCTPIMVESKNNFNGSGKRS